MANEILKMIKIARKHPGRPFYKGFTAESILPDGDWDWWFEGVKCDFVHVLIENKLASWREVKRAFGMNEHSYYSYHQEKAKSIIKKYKSKKPYGLADMLI